MRIYSHRYDAFLCANNFAPTTSLSEHRISPMNKLFGTDISIDTFLAKYWQQKPLLIRNAFPDLINPLSPEELAGLACEEGSNARLILEDCGDKRWCVEYGPFDEHRFTSLPESDWSLLVSDVERILPAARDIQQHFRFIPDWRLDDIMLSYAPAGGSVGPHVDAYDVFLLQTYGQRRWQIDTDHADSFLPDTDLEILQTFKADQDWVLEPGDMLYLPPNIAHHGVAVDDCMTCSIGFRAPSSHDMLASLLDSLSETNPDKRYSDAKMSLQQHSAEICDDSLKQIRSILNNALQFDDEHLARWFGEFISDSKSQLEFPIEDKEQVEDASELFDLDNDTRLRQNPACRFFFSRHCGATNLFVDGECHRVSENFAKVLCSNDVNSLQVLKKACTDTEDENCLVSLVNSQLLFLDR